MKLVEVVFLIGSHCVSPIQHTVPVTEVFKVQCAVVVERDTLANSVVITPDTESANPLVIAAVERLQSAANPASGPERPQDDGTASAATPELPPAADPAGNAPVPAPASTTLANETPVDLRQRAALTEFRARPEVIGTNESQDPPAEVEGDDAPPPTTEAASGVEEATPPELKPKPRATRTAKKSKARIKPGDSRCGRGRTAVWYTNRDGRRKYRCRRSSGPQLY